MQPVLIPGLIGWVGITRNRIPLLDLGSVWEEFDQLMKARGERSTLVASGRKLQAASRKLDK